MTLTSSLAARVGLLLLLAGPAVATPIDKPKLGGLASAEQFVLTCTSKLALSDEQRTGLREYLEQEMNFLAVQRANHTAAEVAELLPAQRDELYQVASRLMSPTQLRRFRELEATPKMQDYLRQMDLVK